jgi:conjugative transfer signal peptidase TraF
MSSTRHHFPHVAKLCLAGATLFLLSCFFLSHAGYRINWTPSVPQGIWKVDDLTGPLQRGQIVSICPPDTAIFQMARSRNYLACGSCPGNYVSLLKPVAAIAGDLVAVSSQGIVVNGVLLPNSKAPTQDSVGRPMEPVKAGIYTVKPGTVWLVSTYPHSFDSRYFGPLPSANILGTAKPVWVKRQIQ